MRIILPSSYREGIQQWAVSSTVLRRFPDHEFRYAVAHGSELYLLFGMVPELEALANALKDYFISFVSDLDPGDAWRPYTNESKEVMQLVNQNMTMIRDDWDIEKTDFLNTAAVLNEFEK